MTILSNGHLWKHSEFIENKNFFFDRDNIFKSLSKSYIEEDLEDRYKKKLERFKLQMDKL